MPPRDIYSPVPTERPAPIRGDVATPSVHIAFPEVRISGAVGEALGQLGRGYGTLSEATKHVAGAFDSLGRSLEGAGDKIFQRAMGLQELENETQRNKAMVELEQYTSEKRLELDQTKGANASPTMLRLFNEDMEKKRQELRAKLPPIEQKRFDPPSTLLTGRAGIHAATHIAQEVKASALGASSARVDLAVKSMGEANSTEEFMESYNTARREVYNTAGPIQGWTREQMETHLRDKAERGFAAMVVRTSETDPPKAYAMLSANPDIFIDPRVEEQVRKSVKNNEIHWAVRNGVDRATKDLWDDRGPGPSPKTEAEMIDEAKRGLPENLRDDPQAKEMVERGVIGAVSRHNNAVRDYRVNTFDNLTSQFRTPDGVLKNTIEEVWASSPDAKAMYDSLPPTGIHSQKALRDALYNLHRTDQRIDPLVSRQNRRLIEGMAQDSDESRMKLMDMNLYDPSLKLNLSDRDAVVKVRNQLKSKPNGDPRVNRGWKWMEDAFPEQFKALGLSGVKKDDPDLIRAKGDFWAAMQAYEETHKGVVPDYKAVVEEIAPQLLKSKTWEWQFGVTPAGFPTVIKPGEEPQYKQEVPEDIAAKIKKDYNARYGHDPTDDEVFRGYRQAVWETFYQSGGTPPTRSK